MTTDIIFLRRLGTGERSKSSAWLDLAEHRNPDGVAFQINEYFAANPHMMLGTMRQAGTMYRANEPTLAPDGRDLAAALREAIAFLPEGVMQGVTLAANSTASSVKAVEQPILAPDHIKENAFTTLEDGRVATRWRWFLRVAAHSISATRSNNSMVVSMTRELAADAGTVSGIEPSIAFRLE